VDNADRVRQLVLEEARANLRDLLTSATREVPRLAGETDAQYEARRIGGYCYHTLSAATLQEMLSHSFYMMTEAMPVIHDLFWGRRALEDVEVRAQLEKSCLKEARESDFDGLSQNGMV
jgi:hypothetical protein